MYWKKKKQTTHTLITFSQIISHDGYLQETSVASLESSILWADGFLLLYSITQRISFLEIPGLKRLIDQTKKGLGKTRTHDLSKGSLF